MEVKAFEQVLQLSDPLKQRLVNQNKSQIGYYNAMLKKIPENDKYETLREYLRHYILRLKDENKQINKTIKKKPKPQKKQSSKKKKHFDAFDESNIDKHIEPSKGTPIPEEYRHKNHPINENYLTLNANTMQHGKSMAKPKMDEVTEDKSKQCDRGRCKNVRYANTNYCWNHYQEERYKSK